MSKKYTKHAKRFSRSDDSKDQNEEEPDAGQRLERAIASLGNVIEGVRERERGTTVEILEKFVEGIEKKRSRRAPIPKGDDQAEARGDTHEARNVQAIGPASDPLYRRMESGRSIEEKTEFRSARNPKMDQLAREWATAASNGDVGSRVRLHDQMNDEYYRAMGFSRAPLLEGIPNVDSGLAVGTGAELLPLPLAGQLIVERDKASKMRRLVNVFTMTTQTQRVPVLPTVVATSRLENAAYADNTPNPDSFLLSAKDIGVSFSAGRNFLEDAAFNLANQLTVVAGGAIGAEEDRQICTSTAAGGDITEGLGAATITDIAEAVLNSIAFVDIVALYYGVPEQYRSGARFFATGTTLVDLMAIVDAVSRPVFLDAFSAPRPLNDIDSDAVGTLFGKPVHEVPLVDDVVIFGDPKWYALGNRAGIRVDVDRTIGTGLRTWVIDERIDGRVIPTSVVGTNNAWRKIVY